MRNPLFLGPRIWRVVLAGLLLGLPSGCANRQARHRLEGVARGWCEMLRASQVIPVYPPTEDLVPGDVFLVQTPVSTQARLYRARGFLPLDDHRTRLTGLDYRRMYFDGYWQDAFGATPHPRAGGEASPAAAPGRTLEAAAPRVAFPSYAFTADSRFGLSLALPVQGVPLALEHLGTEQVRGHVTLSDARSYAAGEDNLLEGLREWADRPESRSQLAETVQRADGATIFLRVVSRVFLVGAVDLSLQRRGGTRAEGAAGGATPGIETVKSGLDPGPAGGSARWVAASSSAVTLAQRFDRPLVIGYLGFDVPVLRGGGLGAPLPTFQRLEGRLPDPDASLARMSPDQQRVRVDLAALRGLAATQPEEAVRVVRRIVQALRVEDFQETRRGLESLSAARVRELLEVFERNAVAFVAREGVSGANHTRFDDAFLQAFAGRHGPPE